MIFVTVGTQKFQFNRLIKEVDDYVGNSNEVAFGQIGNSTYKPKNFVYKNFRDIRKKVTYTNLSSSIYEFLNSTSILI